MKQLKLIIITYLLLAYNNNAFSQRQKGYSERIKEYVNTYVKYQCKFFDVRIDEENTPDTKWNYYIVASANKDKNPNVSINNSQVSERNKLQIQNSNIELIKVEGGSFQMGNNFRSKDSYPVHEVNIKDFYIGKYEVTWEQWFYVMANEDFIEYKNSFYEKNGISPNFDCPKCPMAYVSYNEVMEFIKRLNQKSKLVYRLPTEAEWEYAAKGGSKNKKFTFSGSDDIEKVAWYNVNSNYGFHPVGEKKPNSLGIYDMSGNVLEWCSDWYDENYYQQNLIDNPKGPFNGEYRVMRGGFYNSGMRECDVTTRDKELPQYGKFYIGFRLACD